MGYDRPSWKEIDNSRDRTSHGRRRDKNKKDFSDHSSKYDKYKSDLNRLFDQGMAGELLKSPAKEKPPSRLAKKAKTATSEHVRKKNGRIPRDNSAAINRFRLTKTIIDANEHENLVSAIDELIEHFGLIDDLEVLVRVLEHPDETLVLKAANKIMELLDKTSKIPRRLSLKERLRTIAQTATQGELRQQADDLEQKL